MGDVVTLPVEQNRIWVCWCGCSTFELRESGEPLCAACGETFSDGGWFTPRESAPWTGPPPTSLVSGQTAGFARRRVADMAHDENASVIMVARQDGSVSVWSDVETSEQVSLVRRSFVTAIGLVRQGIC